MFVKQWDIQSFLKEYDCFAIIFESILLFEEARLKKKTDLSDKLVELKDNYEM